MNDETRPLHERCGMTVRELTAWVDIVTRLRRQTRTTKALRVFVLVAVALAVWVIA